MRDIVNFAAAVLFAGATVTPSIPANAAEDALQTAGGITVFGWPVAGPRRAFAPDRGPRTKAPKPADAAPLDAAACRSAGGRIEDFPACGSGKACSRPENDGGLHQVCLSHS